MNSTMAVRKWFRVFGVVALATLVVPGVRAQQTQVQTQDTTMLSEFPQPKDPRTRATMHTELASLYFEDGNLIVALEELTLATARAGWCSITSKSWIRRKKTFSVR